MSKRLCLPLLLILLLTLTFPAMPVGATDLCTGGSVTYDGGNEIHTFTSSGSFDCATGVTVDYLIVAGGGSGGSRIGGGGGAGGLLQGTGLSVGAGENAVVVGDGGEAVKSTPGTQGNNGGNSSYYGQTAIGGGGGGYYNLSNGSPGGSGGGGGGNSSGGAGGSHTSGQGNNGGAGMASHSQAGGGGGAGMVGGNAGTDNGGTGGDGIASSISGSSVYYAGGGGGASDASAGYGGNGGGGAGGINVANATSGTANTGGGGGGARNNADGSNVYSGAGGSGIVIIRLAGEATETPTPTTTNTSTNTPTPTSTIVITDTPTPTHTPTSTLTSTITPIATIIWAPSPFSISIALQNALAFALLAAPPLGSSENVYGVINAQADGSGGWYISLVNIVGVDSPYTSWDALGSGAWRGSMDCTGTEPTWTCDYYHPSPPPGGGDATGLVFPWAPGTFALYGSKGIHHDNLMFAGDDAVDFLGDDTLQSSMPPYMYAPATGTVTWSCQGPHNGGIILDGPSGKFMLFHLEPNQAAFQLGTSFYQGQQIGKLAYGTFDDTIAPYYCGSASENATEYHVHFAWMPSGTTLSMGGCILDLSSANWLCGTTTIAPTGSGRIMNGGGSSPPPTPSGPTITPGGPTLTPVPGQVGSAGGGDHIWNGLIQAVVDFIKTNAANTLGVHTPSPSLALAVDTLWNTTMSFGYMIQALQMTTIIPTFMIWGLILLIEGIRWVYVAYRYVVRLFPMP